MAGTWNFVDRVCWMGLIVGGVYSKNLGIYVYTLPDNLVWVTLVWFGLARFSHVMSQMSE